MSIISRLRWIRVCFTLIFTGLLMLIAANINALVDKRLGIERPIIPKEVDPDDEIMKKGVKNA